jgi:lysozyme family protein
MTTTGFARAMPRILAHEGGKVDDPQDPGGRTNQGVTQAVYTAYRARIGASSKDVWDMRPEERDQIYREQYWTAIRADDLPAGLDYVVFDGAVNSGVSRSAKWLQQALDLPADGHVGAITLAAAQAANTSELIDRICDIRMAFLNGLKHWPRFGRGWTARVSGVRTVGKAWANRSAISVAPPQPTPKATKPPASKSPGWLETILAAIFGRTT